jgi:hypothetical protein
MDIHPPEGPIRSVREFLLHLLTITIGILIALALEGLVTRWQENKLLTEARANLRAELTNTREKAAKNIAAQHEAQDKIRKLLDYATALRKNRHTADPNIAFDRSFITLASTSWDAALATKAIALMPYDEVARYSQAYTAERAYSDLETEAIHRWFEIAAIDDSDPTTATDAEIIAASQQLRISLALAASLEAAGGHMLQAIDAALAPPP